MKFPALSTFLFRLLANALIIAVISIQYVTGLGVLVLLATSFYLFVLTSTSFLDVFSAKGWGSTVKLILVADVLFALWLAPKGFFAFGGTAVIIGQMIWWFNGDLLDSVSVDDDQNAPPPVSDDRNFDPTFNGEITNVFHKP